MITDLALLIPRLKIPWTRQHLTHEMLHVVADPVPNNACFIQGLTSRVGDPPGRNGALRRRKGRHQDI
jgi:hypothetical protein